MIKNYRTLADHMPSLGLPDTCTETISLTLAGGPTSRKGLDSRSIASPQEAEPFKQHDLSNI